MTLLCSELGCKKYPSYNYIGEKKRVYCSTHKKTGMVNVKDNLCNEINCTKVATYNNNGEKYGIYCKMHKMPEMIDVINKKCKYPDCDKVPNYNYESEKSGVYCASHKKDKMICVTGNTCLEPGCKKHPSYNTKGNKNGIYCAEHKLPGMTDIVNKKCIYNDCNKQPVYNNIGETNGLYCKLHKIEGMINIKDAKCMYNGCNTIPTYNYEGEKKAIYCTTHKQDGMIDIKHKKCKTHLCNTIVQNKYEGYCINCFIHLFPDRPNSLNYKTKERAVVEYVFEQFPEDKYTWITDKRIQDGCSRRRPDLLLDLGYQIIIIEVDENQHIDYDCSCENKRLMLLSQDVGHRPIIFIRFNPDEYLEKDGKKVTSCWSLNGNGICTVKKTKQKEWATRLEALKIQLEYWITPENKTDKTIEVVQLFYDHN